MGSGHGKEVPGPVLVGCESVGPVVNEEPQAARQTLRAVVVGLRAERRESTDVRKRTYQRASSRKWGNSSVE
jgi:hypothetical protein